MDGYVDFCVRGREANVGSSAKVTSDIVEPLVYHVVDEYHSCFLEGSIYAVYEDSNHDIVDKVTIHLNGSNEADVFYLTYNGMVKISESWLRY
jgi:hypothetical protein